MWARHVEFNRITADAHNRLCQLAPIIELFLIARPCHDRRDDHAVGVRVLYFFKIREPKLERLVRDQFPIPRRVRHGVGALHARDIWFLFAGALIDRFRASDVFDRMQANRLGDNPAPSGLKRFEDLAFTLSGRRGGQNERIDEIQSCKGRRKFSAHSKILKIHPKERIFLLVSQ